ncbi:hypothetical protein IQ247_06655 [Plectonema cf. radiosum LEGE 06105]|uniref:Uncharacterized protein n=1 Tax=Plectonema cf. radiosum LEGE 06105 TaxID=945769 RepID=A0A8J7K0C3_9CYAN|nr:hypothetical protein [Plectonema radiosum]MBE9212392.1 hypothetical protein [Plectonema cf. radiosum LEGE 06105]
MNFCPCCNDTLLSHISNNHTYWFCPTCWQEMPVCALPNSHSFTEVISNRLSKMHQKIDKSSLSSSKSSMISSELALMQV